MIEKLPSVAIVGQTNAGKSSLFNRIIGYPQAIVAREPGTTRDSVIGRVEYDGFSFWLVDTAGIKDPEDEFEATIQDQIEEAAEAPDFIIMTIDSTIYPNEYDRQVAKRALKSKKPILLALNKSDLKTKLPDFEFQALGIKDIVSTSATHGQGIDKLLSKIIQSIPKQDYIPNDDTLRIALIGRPNVGKSTLYNTLASKQQAIVADVAGTTRDVNHIELRYNSQNIELLDTAGVRKQGKQERGIEKFSVLRTLNAIEQSDICLLLIDANQLNVALDQRLAGIIADSGKGLIVVVSKWDSVEDKDAYTYTHIGSKISEHLKFVPWAPLIFVSSLTGQNTSKILDLAIDIKARRAQQTKTRDLNILLQDAVASHPIAGLKNTHPKLRYIVQTDTAPPWFVIYGSRLKFLHWSYKRYLERKIREKYDYSGTSIKFSYIDENQIKQNKLKANSSKVHPEDENYPSAR